MQAVEDAESVKAPRRPRTFDAGTTTPDALDTLLRDRYSGAVNIRGIRFQVRYAALRAVTMAHTVRAAAKPAEAEPRDQLRADGGRVPGPPALDPGIDAMQQPLLRMEGIEDVDVADPSLGPLRVLGQPTHAGGEYVQVKTSASSWNWAKLKEPLLGWIELHRTGAVGVTFRLVVNFDLTGDLALLGRFRELALHQQRDVQKKFRQLAAKLDASEAEADAVLKQLVIEQVSDGALYARLRSALTDAFNIIDGAALDAFELALTGRVLEWSEQRATIRAVDVLAHGQAIGEGLARQAQFNAVAHGLIGKIDFTPDATPDDFFLGRRTRVGHVGAGLDVRRADWLGRVDAALARAGVCVIRAPSGHGKSTLAFRYVYEHWPASQVLLVRSAQTAEEVAALSDYVRHRRQLGLPVRVLIDADYRTRFWPEVAAAAASVGAQVLVTVRSEDYQRYPLHALTRREIIEPTLSVGEATDIFGEFKRRGHVAPNVTSAGWAYERLRRPPLLLEYIYLLTQGVMLEDRLRDQVQAFHERGEDPAKRDILRLVSLGSALGAPVRLEPLLDAVALHDDPQVVLQPLVGEYLVVEDGLISGLHWVRSEHLARLLHDGGVPPIHHTALRLLSLVPDGSLPFVVANALSWEGIDRSAFVAGLVERYRAADSGTLASVLEGLFEAGERQFFETNRAPFDEAHAQFGPDGMFLLWAETAPMLRAGTIDRMIAIMGDKAGSFPRYKAWAEQVPDAPRGLDLVRTFLQEVAPSRAAETLLPNGATGRLLDWCALTGVRLPHWDAARDGVVRHPGACTLALDDALDLVQGLFRYDRDTFDRWFANHGETWLAYVQRRATGLALSIRAPSSVETTELARARNPGWVDSPEAMALGEEARRQAIEDAAAASSDAARHGVPSADVELRFAVPHDGASRWGDETVRRLELLRRGLPFVGRYRTQGEFLLPAGVVLPVDDTTKAVPRWNLPLPSDVAKNRAWGDVVARAYLPDSFYRFQERWATARMAALRVVRGLNLAITRALQGRTVDVSRAFGPGGDAMAELHAALREVPWLSPDQFAMLGQPLSDALAAELKAGAPNKWRNDTTTFLRQIIEFFNESSASVGRLAVVNFRSARAALMGMHAFFEAMFLDAPDYFDVRALNDEERAAYDNLAILLVGRITEPMSPPVEHPISELRARAARREASEVSAIAQALNPLIAAGRAIVPPRGIVLTGELKATAIGVDVRQVESPMDDLLPVLKALQPVAALVDWFYLVPLQNGERLSDGAYSVSAHRWRDGEDPDQWDERDATAVAMSLMLPTAVPAEIIPLLPDLPLATTRTEPSFAQRSVGLYHGAEVYARRRRQIEAIGGAAPLTEIVALRTELRDTLKEFEAELGSSAAALRDDVGRMAVNATSRNARDAVETLRLLASDVEVLLAAAPGDRILLWLWTAESVERAGRALEGEDD